MAFNRLRLLRLSRDSNWETIISQHKEIFQLIVNKDAERASEVMANHLQLVVIEQELIKERFPHYFV
jgi:GntR family transcriptional regulator, rspAB operon transcriptional repressor